MKKYQIPIAVVLAFVVGAICENLWPLRFSPKRPVQIKPLGDRQKVIWYGAIRFSGNAKAEIIRGGITNFYQTSGSLFSVTTNVFQFVCFSDDQMQVLDKSGLMGSVQLVTNFTEPF